MAEKRKRTPHPGAKVLKAKQDALGMNQSQFAKHLGVLQESLSYFYSGRRRLGRQNLEKIAAKYPGIALAMLREGTMGYKPDE